VFCKNQDSPGELGVMPFIMSGPQFARNLEKQKHAVPSKRRTEALIIVCPAVEFARGSSLLELDAAYFLRCLLCVYLPF